MKIVLPPELEALVKRRLDSGLYDSPAEVVRDALQLLDDFDRFETLQLEELKREVAIGLEQLDRGETVTFDEALAERIKARGRRRLAKGDAAESDESRRPLVSG